jgi:AcrR family transcriptional regulator
MARPNVSGERKKQVLDTAMVVFARKGFHQARMDDIVNESGLSKGAIYWYFKSKDDILLELIEHIFQQEMDYLRTLVVESHSVSACLEQFTRHTMRTASEMTSFLPLLYELYALAAREEHVHAVLQCHFRGFRELLLPLFQQGIERGEFRPMDTETALIAYTSLFEGLALMWTVALDRQAFDLEALAQQSVRLFLQGLAVPSNEP